MYNVYKNTSTCQNMPTPHTHTRTHARTCARACTHTHTHTKYLNTERALHVGTKCCQKKSKKKSTSILRGRCNWAPNVAIGTPPRNHPFFPPVCVCVCVCVCV